MREGALTTLPAAQSGCPTEDLDLVAAARAGNEAAFVRLYERYARLVHGILLARVPRSEVEDLRQDVFLQAWRQLKSLRDAGAFAGWLARIARHRAVDYHRQTPILAELTREPSRPAVPLAEAEEVLRLIQSLPEAYRETLVLRLVEGMTGPEIAAETGLTPESVRVNLHRGMKLLREKWEGGAPR